MGSTAAHIVNLSRIAIVLTVLFPGSIHGAMAWPDRTVRVITPTGPGGGSDAIARTMADALAKRWKQSVSVENKPGADGIIAVSEFLQAQGGHTLLFSTTSTVTVNPIIHEKLSYDPAHDLVPISFVVDDFISVIAAPALGVSTLSDLVSVAQSRPKEFNYATVPGSPYLAFLGFQRRAGIDLTFVPYRNPIASINDVAEGRIQVAVLPLGTVLGQAQAGNIKVLAVTSEKRAPTAPDVPTVAEAGFPEFTFGGGLGFFGAKGISRDLRERIAADVKAVLDEPEVQQRIANLGYVPRGTSPAAFKAMLEEHTAKWARIAIAYGAKPSQ